MITMQNIRNIFIITVGRVLILLTSIISIRILTTLLSPVEIGRFNIILAIFGWFGLVIVNPVGMYVNRKLLEWYSQRTAINHLISLGKYILFIASLSIIILSIFKPFIGIDINYFWLVLLIFGCIIFTSGNMGYVSYLNLLGLRLWFVIITILTIWVGLGLSTFMVLWKGHSAEYWLTGQLIGQGLLLLLAIVILFRFFGRNADNKMNNNFSIPVVLKFAWPLSIGVFFYWIHTQGYRFAYQRVAGVDNLGIFVLGLGIGGKLVSSFEELFNQYYGPIFYNEIANSTKQQRTVAWNRYALAFFPAVILVIMYINANGKMLAEVFAAKTYFQIRTIILWGAIAEGLRTMISVISLVSHSQLEMRPLILPSVVGAITAITGIILFVPYEPFVGGGVALSMGWLVLLVYLYIKMKRLLPIQIHWKRIFYSFFWGTPLIIYSKIINIMLPDPTISQSLILLSISGLYLLLAQFILARKWLSLPVKIQFIDTIEQKLKFYFTNKYDF